MNSETLTINMNHSEPGDSRVAKKVAPILLFAVTLFLLALVVSWFDGHRNKEQQQELTQKQPLSGQRFSRRQGIMMVPLNDASQYVPEYEDEPSPGRRVHFNDAVEMIPVEKYLKPASQGRRAIPLTW